MFLELHPEVYAVAVGAYVAVALGVVFWNARDRV